MSIVRWSVDNGSWSLLLPQAWHSGSHLARVAVSVHFTCMLWEQVVAKNGMSQKSGGVCSVRYKNSASFQTLRVPFPSGREIILFWILVSNYSHRYLPAKWRAIECFKYPYLGIYYDSFQCILIFSFNCMCICSWLQYLWRPEEVIRSLGGDFTCSSVWAANPG